MNWQNALTFSSWKIVFSLVPFIFPVVQTLVEINLKMRILPIDISIFLEATVAFIFLLEIIISQPFEQLLRAFGWWSNNGIFIAPDGPLLPGSFLVAIIYSLLLYLLFSAISLVRQKRKLSM